jgi:quercetin dioxygenase-like cupin family protein
MKNMICWKNASLKRQEGRHIYSGKDVRIQVIPVSNKPNPAKLWTNPHGSMLALVLVGPCLLCLKDKKIELRTGDQVLFETGDSFAFCI